MPVYKIILNPTSGKGAGANALPIIKERLQELELEYDLEQTEYPGHAIDLARAAVQGGFEIVVAAGGDGTANEVLNGLMQAKLAGEGSATLAVLSVGRGNDFSYGVGIPTELEAGFAALAKGDKRRIDIGKMEGGDFPDGRFFGNGIGIGFDTVVGLEAAKMKRLSGFLGYLVAALKTIFLYYHAPTVECTLDGKTETFSPLMISVMNGQRMGGGFYMAPNGDPADGWLNVTMVGDVSRPRILTLMPYFMKGTQETQPEVSTLLAKEISIKALQGTLPAHGDGETICEAGEALAISLLPNQMEIICQLQEESL